MSDSATCRWGILSAAAIAKKNWRAIAKSPSGTLNAVASRRIDAAQAFIAECQSQCPQTRVPDAIEGYTALLDRDDIDAVYIPLPTGLRKEWIIAAANHGKHVLAEKPTALSAKDLEEILAVCDRNRVQFMDGVMFMHSQRLPKLREVLEDGQSIGEVRRIACQFSFFGGDDFSQNNIRVDSELEPFGCLGDLGWYCIRFLLWANQWQMPNHIVGKCIHSLKGAKSEKAVPADFSAELSFPNGSTASFYCSFMTGHQQWVHINGTRGNAVIPDFVLPYFGNQVSFEVENPAFVTNVCDFHMQKRSRRISVDEYGSGYAPAQEINMFETFNQIVVSKKLDPHWGKISLATQRVMDQLYESAK